MANQEYTLPKQFVADNGTTYTPLGGAFRHKHFESGVPINTDDGKKIFRLTMKRELHERSGHPITPEGFLGVGSGQVLPFEWKIDIVELDDGPCPRYGVSLLTRNRPGDRFIPVPVGETTTMMEFKTNQPKLTSWGAKQYHVRLDNEFVPQQGFEFNPGFELVIIPNDNPKSERSPQLNVNITTRAPAATQPSQAQQTYPSDDDIQVTPAANFVPEVSGNGVPPSPEDDIAF